MSELTTRFIDDTYAEYSNTGKHELAQIYIKTEADKVIAEKDKEITELKAKITKSKELADGIRCDIEKVKADAAETLALLEERNRQIGELKTENERPKATPEEIMKEIFDKMLIYPHDMVRLEDAYRLAVSLRKTKRALYKACANWAHFAVAFFSSYATKEKWRKMFSKCLKKAQEYK